MSTNTLFDRIPRDLINQLAGFVPPQTYEQYTKCLGYSPGKALHKQVHTKEVTIITPDGIEICQIYDEKKHGVGIEFASDYYYQREYKYGKTIMRLDYKIKGNEYIKKTEWYMDRDNGITIEVNPSGIIYHT